MVSVAWPKAVPVVRARWCAAERSPEASTPRYRPAGPRPAPSPGRHAVDGRGPRYRSRRLLSREQRGVEGPAYRRMPSSSSASCSHPTAVSGIGRADKGQVTTSRTYVPRHTGYDKRDASTSSPAGGGTYAGRPRLCGCSSMVELQPSKLAMPVRSRSPARYKHARQSQLSPRQPRLNQWPEAFRAIGVPVRIGVAAGICPATRSPSALASGGAVPGLVAARGLGSSPVDRLRRPPRRHAPAQRRTA